MANVESIEDLNSFYDRGLEILNAVIDVFTSNGVDVPERRFVSIGDIDTNPHDANDILSVYLGQVVPNSRDGRGISRNCGWDYLMGTFHIELVRCTPQPAKLNSGLREIPPDLLKVEDYGKSRLQEMFLITKACEQIVSDDPIGRANFVMASGKDSGGVQAIKFTIETVV